LFDADNAQVSTIPGIVKDIESRGECHIRRVYGDWTQPYLKKWKPLTQQYSLNPVQQFMNTTG